MFKRGSKPPKNTAQALEYLQRWQERLLAQCYLGVIIALGVGASIAILSEGIGTFFLAPYVALFLGLLLLGIHLSKWGSQNTRTIILLGALFGLNLVIMTRLGWAPAFVGLSLLYVVLGGLFLGHKAVIVLTIATTVALALGGLLVTGKLLAFDGAKLQPQLLRHWLRAGSLLLLLGGILAYVLRFARETLGQVYALTRQTFGQIHRELSETKSLRVARHAAERVLHDSYTIQESDSPSKAKTPGCALSTLREQLETLQEALTLPQFQESAQTLCSTVAREVGTLHHSAPAPARAHKAPRNIDPALARLLSAEAIPEEVEDWMDSYARRNLKLIALLFAFAVVILLSFPRSTFSYGLISSVLSMFTAACGAWLPRLSLSVRVGLLLLSLATVGHAMVLRLSFLAPGPVGCVLLMLAVSAVQASKRVILAAWASIGVLFVAGGLLHSRGIFTIDAAQFTFSLPANWFRVALLIALVLSATTFLIFGVLDYMRTSIDKMENSILALREAQNARESESKRLLRLDRMVDLSARAEEFEHFAGELPHNLHNALQVTIAFTRKLEQDHTCSPQEISQALDSIETAINHATVMITQSEQDTDDSEPDDDDATKRDHSASTMESL